MGLTMAWQGLALNLLLCATFHSAYATHPQPPPSPPNCPPTPPCPIPPPGIPFNGSLLEHFVDEVPLIKVVFGFQGTPENAKPLATPLVMGMWEVNQSLHRDLPMTRLYAYGRTQAEARWPGPLIIARRYVPLQVKWENHLGALHILAPYIDTTLLSGQQGVATPPFCQGVQTTPHVHGGENAAYSDGHPDSWWTNPEVCNRTENCPYCTGRAYTTENFRYHNMQLPSTFFFHDHTYGITRMNVYAGLAGGYAIVDPAIESKFKLPTGINVFDIPLVIQDRILTTDGQLFYTTNPDPTKFHPKWNPEFFGDIITVNGKAWPYLNVQPCIYRFRLIEGSSARFYTFRIVTPEGTAPVDIPIYIIATDGGYLDKPYRKANFTIAPGQRRDILVDFSKAKVNDTIVILGNSAPTPFPGDDPPAGPQSEVLQFRVVKKDPKTASKCLTGSVPKKLLVLPPIQAKPVLIRPLILVENSDPQDRVVEILLNNLTYYAPATELPQLLTVELWDYINTTPDTHPMHTHLVTNTVVFRRPYNVASFRAQTCQLDSIVNREGRPVSAKGLGLENLPSCYTGPTELPTEEETGIQDTVRTPPGYVTRIRILFASQAPLPASGKVVDFPFDATKFPGYVWHCHIIDHEDNDMMRPYNLVHPRNANPKHPLPFTPFPTTP